MEKVAIVTGSRRGIGLAIIRSLIRQGYHPIISDVVPKDEVSELLEELHKENISADYVRCDISNADDRAGLMKFVAENYGRLDVHVNNAGVAPKTRLDILETTEESYDFVMDINLKGCFFMCQSAANLMINMKKRGLEDYSPRIINIASMSSYTASVNRGEYCVSKAGISMVTKLFAAKLAEYGIPVFEVRPGIIMTDMTTAVKEKYQGLIDDGLTPIQRFGTPEDVANCVMSAVSGNLDFATGQVLNADGGFHIRRI